MNAKTQKVNPSDLLKELTLDEKILLCSGKNFWELNGIERLGLPSIMVADGPHGLRKQGGSEGDHMGIGGSVPAICFPTAVGLASTWNTELIGEVGVALGQLCKQEQVSVLLGPGINIKRSPLCGRNFEYFSEDPYLTGQLSSAFVQGVQSQGIGTSLKHYAANNQEFSRITVDAIVDERALREIYLPAFEYTVKSAQPWTVMASYNKLNGEYVTDSKAMLTDILKDEWGHTGLVITDWGAVNNRPESIAAGLELEMPGNHGSFAPYIKQAIENDVITTQDLDKVVLRLLDLIVKSKNNLDVQYKCDLEAQHQLAVKAVEQSCVLLKNDDGLLPLSADDDIAVIGVFAKEPRYQGAGSSQINPTKVDVPFDQLQQRLSNSASLTYAAGYRLESDVIDNDLIAEARAVAKVSKKIILFAGLPDSYESEGFDRQHMRLPEPQLILIKALTELNIPLVLVLQNGSPIEMPFLNEVPCVLEAYLTGQAGGTGISRILLGESNPSGKLAETFPVNSDDVLAHHHFPGTPRQVQYRESIWVGYRYFDKADIDVAFPFGHGLSYSQYTYSDLQLINIPNKTVEAENLASYDGLEISCEIKNTSSIAGYEIAQLYVHDVTSTVFKPEQELKAFSKIWLEPGEEKTVEFELGKRSFSHWDTAQNKWVIQRGDFEVRVGASSKNIFLVETITVESSDTIADDSAQIPAYSKPNANGFSEAEFQQLFGRAIPEPEVTYPFHINSTMLDIRSTFIGKRIYKKALEDWQPDESDSVNDAKMKRMIRSLISESPVRQIATMSDGKVPRKRVFALVHLLNGHYLKALWTLVRKGL